MPIPDLDTMTREEIHQRFHELHVKQIETELKNEQLCSQLEEMHDQTWLFSIVNENMLDMVALTDMEGNFIFAGKAHEILGYKPGFWVGKNVMDFVHPEALGFMKENHYLRRQNPDAAMRHYEFRLITRHKEMRNILIGVDIIPETNQSIASCIDITKRIQAEKEKEMLQAQLNQAQKMESVGRLAGGVAHDFNNKLTIINSYAEMATDMLDPSDPLRLTIKEIHTAGQQSADIVRQLLAFARRQTISPVLLDLNDTVASMLKMLQRLIGENIDLKWHPGKNLWPVKIDPSQVDQVMANLAVNARDAIADVGKVTIETKNTIIDEDYCKTNPEANPGRYVVLAVSDDGCGVENEIKSQLFEPFFTTKDVGKGTGLGLPTIYGIVKQNNGFVNVYSEPGEGTTFKIYLPSQDVEKASVHSDKKFSGNIPMGTETILIVEDEKTILQVFRRILEKLGYTVQAAGNPAEALKLSQEYGGTIHLLITDVVMPEMNGRDLSSQLVKNRPGLKTLYMSGYTANVIAHHGVLDQGVQFIQKPFSMKDLAVKVREVIEQG